MRLSSAKGYSEICLIRGLVLRKTDVPINSHKLPPLQRIMGTDLIKKMATKRLHLQFKIFELWLVLLEPLSIVVLSEAAEKLENLRIDAVHLPKL